MKLRSRKQAVIASVAAFGLAVFCLAIAIQAIVEEKPAAFVFLFAMGVLFVFPIVRASRARAVVEGDMLTVFNVFSTTRVKADEIIEFRLGPNRPTFFYGAAAAELRNGEELIIFGIQTPNAATRPNDSSAQKLVDQLNQWLLDAKVESTRFPGHQ